MICSEFGKLDFVRKLGWILGNMIYMKNFRSWAADSDWDKVQGAMNACVDDLLVLYGVNIGGWMVRFLGEFEIYVFENEKMW